MYMVSFKFSLMTFFFFVTLGVVVGFASGLTWGTSDFGFLIVMTFAIATLASAIVFSLTTEILQNENRRKERGY